MGPRWKRWYVSTSAEPEIDLLSTAFGLPSRRDLERASRTLRPKPPSRYDTDSDATTDDVQVEESDDSSDQSSIQETSRKSKNRRLNRLVTPMPKALSRKRQHTQSRSSSLKSQRSTLSKKIKGSRKIKITSPRDCKTPSPTLTLRNEERSSTSASPSTYLSTAGGLQGSQKSYSPPSLINPNAQQAVPNNTSRLPLLYTQQQIPTFLSHYAPAYLFHPQGGTHATQTPKRNQDASSYSPGSTFQDLQELQLKLDRLRQELLKEPADPQLHKDHQNIQSQLNTLLDSVVARKTKDAQQASLSTAKTPGDAMKSTEPVVGKENVAPDLVDDEVAVDAQFPSVPQDGRDRTLSIAHGREKSSSCTIRHHLCSGCGSVRSQNFHEKHPIGTWPKPVLNFCSSCRDVTLRRGQMDKHHFCYGCGKVRSKAFQKKHKPKPGHPLLPNYCGNCVAEVRVNEGLNEMSVLELTAAQSNRLSEQGGSIADTSSSTVADLFRHGLPYRKSDLTTEELGVKTSKPKNAPKLRLDHASVAKNSSAPVSPAESSPFYPGRRLGSAQRRAQREPAPHFNGEHHGKARDSVVQGEYHAPYVEEADSVSEDRMSRSVYSSVESLNDEAFSEEYEEKNGQKSGKKSFGTANKKFASLQNPGIIYERTAALQSTNSSGERTVRCVPHADSSGQRSTMPRGDPQHNPQDLPHQSSFCGPPRFSKGVFGKSNKDNGSGSGQAIRRKSPLADIECSHYTTFSNREDGKPETRTASTEKPEPPPFRSSRGAFGPNYGPKKSHFSMYQYGRTGSNQSGTRSPDAPENRPAPRAEWKENNSQSGTGEYPQPGHRNSSSPSFSSSNAGKPSNKFKSHIPNETTYARSVFTDYSRSSDNPYYKPRSRPFHDATNSEFCSTWDWKSNRGPSGHFDDRAPEPIIEEPISPSSSPIQPTKLLEFRIPKDDDSSCEPETEDNDCLADHIHLNSSVSFSEASQTMGSTTQ